MSNDTKRPPAQPTQLVAAQPAPAQPFEVAAHAGAESAGQMVRVAAQLAHMNPRNVDRAGEELTRSCQILWFAGEAEYRYPRGGEDVVGPTVRLAREAARCWGNVRYGIEIVGEYEDELHIRGWAWDMESNTYDAHDDRFKSLVQRKKDGETRWVKPDERDRRELVFRRGAILVRNSLLNILPPWLVDQAVATARETLAAAAKQDPRRALEKLVPAFEAYKVSVDMLEGYLGHPIDELTAEELVRLREVYNSIKDGQARVEEFFPPAPVDADGKADGAAPPEDDLDAAIERKQADLQTEPEAAVEPTAARDPVVSPLKVVDCRWCGKQHPGDEPCPPDPQDRIPPEERDGPAPDTFFGDDDAQDPG